MKSLLLPATALAFVLHASLAFAETLQQEMSRKQFEAAGLHKLSEAELAALNEYLGKKAASEAEIFGAEQLEREEKVAEVELIEARLIGDFNGWNGNTVFRLDNGQIWQQRLSGIYRKRASNPEVRVERGRYGYYFRLKGDSRKIAVKRIK